MNDQQKKTYYVTTPIYYPSGKLHIGHTYTTVAADALARFKRETGHEVVFSQAPMNTAQKIQASAIAKGWSPKAYVDGMVEDIKEIWKTHGNLLRYLSSAPPMSTIKRRTAYLPDPL
jgi:methionyl-tRNA synthetase